MKQSRFLLLGSLTLSLVGCQLDPGLPSGRPVAPAMPAKAAPPELRFDERYDDSIGLGPPYSARTQREMAIYYHLTRLKLVTFGAKYDNGIPSNVSEHMGDGPFHNFPSKEAQLADIYRNLDSLKVLEHIPLTPYPPLKL